ncbi:MAG: PhoH family protein [candidate division Zixibacteria bacterium]|nr:PhoH family protein [candidate division Zixibacteria bacterium]
MSTEHTVTENVEIGNTDLRALVGLKHAYITLIEQEFEVKIISRGDLMQISGVIDAVNHTKSVIMDLCRYINDNGELNERYVIYSISMVKEGESSPYEKIGNERLTTSVNTKGEIRPKTVGQKQYVKLIENNDIVFSIGPAGTGKTYLAVAKAVSYFKQRMVNRIILVRPAVEAGESLGFLPGDIRAKVDPYLRPLYDALHDMLAAEKIGKLMETGIIEIAPLAFMRGRTLNSAFVILDEAQNTTTAQMKMFLTRLGEHSKAVINGDVTQIDLKEKRSSGLLQASKILADIKGIGFNKLTEKDVVRHKLVQQIVKAYDKYESRKSRKT